MQFRPRFRPLPWYFRLFALAVIGGATLPLPAAEAGRSVSGRVMSAADGSFLRNARVVVEGTAIDVLTNETGEFQLADLPPGATTLRVSYTGLVPVSVALPAAGAGPLAITLAGFGEQAPAAGEVLKLDAFRVTTSREMSAADMAINEKRIARNIKDVVATDAFGNMSRDNLGDFLQYLPGVEVEGDGTAPLTVGLRGMPAEYTNIEMDGAGLSVPQTGGSTRVTAVRGLTMSNVDRIEITKGPTPDTGADSIGGRINMIPRSSFERSRPELRYRTFVLMNSEFLNFRRTPGGREGGDGKALKWFPDFEVTYVNPVNARFGYALNASRNDYFYTARVAQKTFSTANTSATEPYLTTFTGQVAHSFSRRSALGAKFDFRVGPRDTLSVAYNFNRYWVDFGNRQMTYGTGTLLAAPATGRNAASGDFGPAFTQGRAGQGTVTQLVTQNAYQTTQTHQGQLTYRHRGPLWEFDGTLAKSKTKLTYRLDSYGQLGQARLGLTGVTVRFDDIDPEGGPDRITVTNAAGAVIDTNRLENLGAYTTPVVAMRDIKNNFNNAKFDATRKFRPETFTWTFKTGAAYKAAAKDRAQPQNSRTYAGPAFNALPAGILTDQDFNLEGPGGRFKTQQWLSPGRAYDYYQANPGSYTGNAAADYIAWTTSLEESSEAITAGYAMADASFWRNRVRLAGGFRYEHTHVIARGTLTNLQLQFRRDAQGRILDGNPALPGVQTVPITTDPLEVAKLTRLPLANVVDTTYGDVYPSINGTVTLRENLLLRLGYAHTIGRPTLAQLIPTTSVTEVLAPGENATGSGLGTISTSNPGLKPWSGRNHDVAFEYYTATGGLFSVGAYRRDVTDFISTISTIATREMLEELGLPDDYEGYLLQQPENTAGEVRQTGLELSGRQRLRPWLSVFANYTRSRTKGLRAGDFANAQTRRFNTGVQFAFKAFSVSANYNWTGRRRGAVSGIAPGAFVYTRPRKLVSLSVDYLVRRNLTVYFTLNNLLQNPLTNETYGPATPAYARLTNDRRDGMQVQFGLKGSF